MKKKRNIRSEIRKLLRPDKEKRINSAAEEQADAEKKVILAADERFEPKNELQTEMQKNEYAEPEAEEKVEVQPEEQVELEIGNNIKLGIKNIIPSTAQNTRYELYIQIKLEMNTSMVIKNQPYASFTKMIIGKYGFERHSSTFSKLIFRLYQMMLKEDRIDANTERNMIIKNYNSFFNINKSVFNLLARSIVSTNTKSNKEVRVPFYILRNSQLISSNVNSNGLENEKEAIKLLPKSLSKGEQISRKSKEETSIDSLEKNVGAISNFYNLHYKQKAQENLIETHKEEILNNTVDRITRIISEPISLLLQSQTVEKRIETLATKLRMKNSVTYILSDRANRPAAKLLYDSNQSSQLRALIPDLSRSKSFEKRSLGNRTSIGSNIEIINISKIGSTNRDTSNDINKSNIWTIYEKDNGSSDRTKNAGNSISTNIYKNGITNLAIRSYISESTNIAIGRPINQTTNIAIGRPINQTTNLVIGRPINQTTNLAINRPNNETTNSTINRPNNETTNLTINRANNETTNLTINRPINQLVNLAINTPINETSNGSSNKNIKNNIITNRFDNVLLNTTINRNSNKLQNTTINKNSSNVLNAIINRNSNGELSTTINNNSNGFINKTLNIITNKVTNRLENIEERNRYPQFLLMKNSLANNEPQELKPTELESTEKVVEEQQKSASEDIKQSEIILHTTLSQKDYTPKTKELLRSALIQADGAISKIIKNFSNKQNAEVDEETAYKKNNYQNRTSLIPAEIKQATKLKGTSNFTGKQLEDSSLIFCKPHIKETSIATEEAHKNINKNNEQVFAKSVTSSKPQSKYNLIEVEEVNQIAEKVYKIIEKRIAIQKDRRGLR